MGLIAFFATANASLQMRAPDHLRGRVMGLYALVFQGFFPFGSLGIGMLAMLSGSACRLREEPRFAECPAGIIYRIMKKKNERT